MFIKVSSQVLMRNYRNIILERSNTSDMIFRVPALVSYLSQFMTLLPGDIISTGTPSGVGLGLDPPRYLRPGDVVELGIEELGTSRQTAVAFESLGSAPEGSEAL